MMTSFLYKSMNDDYKLYLREQSQSVCGSLDYNYYIPVVCTKGVICFTYVHIVQWICSFVWIFILNSYQLHREKAWDSAYCLVINLSEITMSTWHRQLETHYQVPISYDSHIAVFCLYTCFWGWKCLMTVFSYTGL